MQTSLQTSHHHSMPKHTIFPIDRRKCSIGPQHRHEASFLVKLQPLWYLGPLTSLNRYALGLVPLRCGAGPQPCSSASCVRLALEIRRWRGGFQSLGPDGCEAVTGRSLLEAMDMDVPEWRFCCCGTRSTVSWGAAEVVCTPEARDCEEHGW